MIFNVGAGGATDADKIKYGDSNVGATLDNLNESVDELNESLTNENAETFNFGVKDGVRGYFTNPSRADDSFIPFKSGTFDFTKDFVSVLNVNETRNYTVTFTINDDISNILVTTLLGSGSDFFGKAEFVFAINGVSALDKLNIINLKPIHDDSDSTEYSMAQFPIKKGDTVEFGFSANYIWGAMFIGQ